MTEPPSQRALAVLVIDDDPNMQRWAGAVLRGAGHRFAVAGDAMVGLMMVRSFHPDVIVLDLGLPAGGGKGLLERLRKLAGYQQLPVVILSGRVTPETPRELAPFGVASLLQKPVEPAAFVAAIQRAATGVLDSSSPS